MNQIIRTLLLTTSLVLLSLSTAFANPISSTTSNVITITAIVLALASDVAVTMLLLRGYRSSLLRLAFAYLAVNLLSFLLFINVILRAFSGLAFPLPEICAEAFVIALETALLFMLINLKVFRTETGPHVTLRSTLVAVTVGNVTSIFSGLLILPATFAFVGYLHGI